MKEQVTRPPLHHDITAQPICLNLFSPLNTHILGFFFFLQDGSRIEYLFVDDIHPLVWLEPGTPVGSTMLALAGNGALCLSVFPFRFVRRRDVR
jgi:hypothetical protein